MTILFQSLLKQNRFNIIALDIIDIHYIEPPHSLNYLFRETRPAKSRRVAHVELHGGDNIGVSTCWI